MVQPQCRIAAICLAAALMIGAAGIAAAQTAAGETTSRAPDGSPFIIELYPEKYNTDYQRAFFGHLLYLSPKQPPINPGELIGRLLEELGPFSNERTSRSKRPTYCLYLERGAPKFESEAGQRVKQHEIDLRSITARQRDAAMKSGECILVTIAAAPVEDLPPPILEVEQQTFESEDAWVMLRGRVTAAAGPGPLYLDREQIPYDRETGRIEYRLEMPDPGKTRTHVVFALDQRKQESEAIRLTLRRIEIPPPRLHDYTEVVETEGALGKVYGYVASRRPLAAVIVDGSEAKLDRDSGYFEAMVAMPAPREPRRVIVIEAYDVDKRRDTARVALDRKLPPPQEVVGPPVIVADRARWRSRAETVEITGHVESKLAIAAVHVGDRPAALDGRNFRATVVLPAPFETATLRVTASDVEGHRAAPLSLALERLPWCPADMLNRGEELRRVQERLNRLGYDAGTADGLFGRKTSAAMDAFWKRTAGETDCSRDGFLVALEPALDDNPPPEEEIAVVDVPEAPIVDQLPIVTEEGPADPQEAAPDPVPADRAPPDHGLDAEPVIAFDENATVTGQATGDMAGWTLTVENRPVRVADDGRFRFPVEGLSCGTNWFRVGLRGPDGRVFASLLEVRRTTALGTWYCHVSTAPPWIWILPAVLLLLLAAASVAKRRKPPTQPTAAKIRLEAGRDPDFTAEVLPGPELHLALRFEDEVHSTEVVAPAPAARLKEVTG